METVNFFTEEAKEYIFGKDEGTNFVKELQNKGIYDEGFQKKISEIQPKKFIEYIKKYLYHMWIMNGEDKEDEKNNRIKGWEIKDILELQTRLIKKSRSIAGEKRDSLYEQMERNLHIIKNMLGQYDNYESIEDNIYICIAKSLFVLNGFTDRTQWIDNQFKKTDSNKASRDSVFIWGFGLKMDVDGVSSFLRRAIREMDFHFRNPYEVVMYYCFKKGLGYEKFKKIWNEFILKKARGIISVKESDGTEKNTIMYKTDAIKLENEEELFDFLLVLVNDLTIYEVTKVVLYAIEDDKKIKIPISPIHANTILEILLKSIVPEEVDIIEDLLFQLKLNDTSTILVKNAKDKWYKEIYNKAEVKRIYTRLATAYGIKDKGNEDILYSLKVENGQIVALEKGHTSIELKVGIKNEFGKMMAHSADKYKNGLYTFEFRDDEIKELKKEHQYIDLDDDDTREITDAINEVIEYVKEIPEENVSERLTLPFYLKTVPYDYTVTRKEDEDEGSYWQSVTLHSLSADREFDSLVKELKMKLAAIEQKKIQGRDPKINSIRKLEKREKKQRERDVKLSEWTNWGDSDVLKKIEVKENDYSDKSSLWLKKYSITWKDWIWGVKYDKNVLGYKKGEHIINRYDIINTKFWCCMYDPEFMMKKPLDRYSIFKDELNVILDRCNMQDLYLADPYEMFIAICVQSLEPKTTYRMVIWEIQQERKKDMEQKKEQKKNRKRTNGKNSK